MKYIITLLTLSLIVISCKKDAGEGGTSSIHGKINIVYRAVLTNPVPADTSAAFDTEVYINYGDQIGPNDRIRTNYKGEYEFSNLRPGDYTIYAYSRDTNAVSIIDPENMVVLQKVTIDKRKQKVEAAEMKIYDRN